MNIFQSSLEGKVGVITGGTSGFGYEITKALSARATKLAVFSIDEPTKEQLRDLESVPMGRVEFIKKDILSPRASETIVKQTLELFGTIDFVVVNAGFAIRFDQPLLKVPLCELETNLRIQFDVFTTSFVSLSLACARVMAPKYQAIEPNETGHYPDSGAIVVTLSEASLCPLRDDLLAYATAKKATQWAMLNLSAILGQKNIRVNGIAPGFAKTRGPGFFYDRFPKIVADIDQKCHLKPSFLHPGAVVPAVLYLLTDNYVTGVTIPLDGGYHIDLKKYFQDSDE